MKFKRLMLSLFLFAEVVLVTPVGLAAHERSSAPSEQHLTQPRHQGEGLNSATDTWHVVVHIIETILSHLAAGPH